MKKKVINMFPENIILPNEGEKYSNLLNDFIMPYEKDFPKEMDIDDVIDFACNAWNLGCMSQIIPESEFVKMLAAEPFPEPENTILRKLIKLKKRKFAKYDRFISDFKLEENNGQLVLTVLTEGKEEFVAEMMDEMPDFLPEENDFEQGYINRHAIVIRPKQPFFDWLNSVYPEEPVNEVDEANIYLVDNGIDNVGRWLRKKFDKFFMMELEDWCTDKKEWPQKRSYKMFQQWFSIDISKVIYDIEESPIHKEN